MTLHKLTLYWHSRGMKQKVIDRGDVDITFPSLSEIVFGATEKGKNSGTREIKTFFRFPTKCEVSFAISAEKLLEDEEQLIKFIQEEGREVWNDKGVWREGVYAKNIDFIKDIVNTMKEAPDKYDIYTHFPPLSQDALGEGSLSIPIKRKGDGIYVETVKIREKNIEQISNIIYNRWVETLPKHIKQYLTVEKEEIIKNIEADNFESSIVQSAAYSLRKEIKKASKKIAEIMTDELTSFNQL